MRFGLASCSLNVLLYFKNCNGFLHLNRLRLIGFSQCWNIGTVRQLATIGAYAAITRKLSYKASPKGRPSGNDLCDDE
jgi:hypothetical protein